MKMGVVLARLFGGVGLVFLTVCRALAETGYDVDGDGVADANHEHVLVVLREGVNPAPEEERVLSTAPLLRIWKARTPRSDFARFLRRLNERPGLDSVRQLTRIPKLRKGGDHGKRRQVLRVRIDRTKTSMSEALQGLAADPDVISAEPDFLEKSQLNDPFFESSGAWGQAYTDQWYLHRISAPDAWSLIPSVADEVTVAVIDSGVDRTHPDLANVVWSNPGEIAGNGLDDDGNGYVDDTNGWNFASRNNDSQDTFGHGTLVAGLISAEQGNGLGIAGAAQGTRIMALRNGESGTSFVSRSIEAVYYAVDQGARVINMSFGGANYSMAFADAIRYALDHGVVLVASSGNSGSESYSHYPSGYTGVISVGATDHIDGVAAFSNYGSAVHLVAPGGGGSDFNGRTMLGCRATNTTLGSAVDAQHVRSSGTSFSAPLVSATAALLLRKNSSLTPSAVQQILIMSADDIESPGWNLKSSYGRLNMRRALEMAAPPVAEITGVTNGQVVSGVIQVTGTASALTSHEYVLEYGSGKTPTSWNVIARSSTPVNEGLLGSWSTAGLMGGDYTLRLTVSAAADHSRAESRVTVFVGMKAPVARDGWPKIGLINTETPTVMDLDGDGVKEIIVSTSGAVRIYTPEGAPFRAGTYQGVLAWPSGPVGVGDIDGDGELEIGTISKSGTSSMYPEFQEVCFWNLDGTKCAGWPISLVRSNDFVPHTLSPTLIDVDRDGVCEVLFPSVTAKNGYPRLHLVRGNGTPMPGWPKVITSSPGADIYCTAGVADLDADGELDFVVADSSGKVHAFNLAGESLPGWPKTVTSGFLISQEVALTDFDRDGRTDVVAAFYDGSVAILDHRGNYKSGWPKNLGSIPRPPAIADLDGDGDLELAVGTQSGMIHVLHHTGVALSGWPKQVNNRIFSPSLVDLNNDGQLDVVASDGSRMLHAWSVNGSNFSTLGFPFQLPGTFGCYSAPIAEDLDGDGKLELVVLGERLEVRNLAAIANPKALPFAHMHCDPANTCRYVLPGKIIKGQKFIIDRGGGKKLDLSGYGLLAGSNVRIGNQDTSADFVSSASMIITAPSNLQTGWQDIHVTHPNSGPTWLANAVLVVEDLFGDTDGDGLSDQWEWSHNFDPLVKNAADSPLGALGDADGDQISNLIEEAFAAMNLNPNRADAQNLPLPKIQDGQITVEYRRNRRDQLRILLSWSPDLKRWFNPGDPDYPAGFQDIDLGTGVGEIENRRIQITLPAGDHGFVRWQVVRPE